MDFRAQEPGSETAQGHLQQGRTSQRRVPATHTRSAHLGLPFPPEGKGARAAGPGTLAGWLSGAGDARGHGQKPHRDSHPPDCPGARAALHSGIYRQSCLWALGTPNHFTHPPSIAHGTTRLADRRAPRSGALHTEVPGSTTSLRLQSSASAAPSPVFPGYTHGMSLPSEPLRLSWECRVALGRAQASPDGPAHMLS